nr:hypothetical protein CFP56_55093 [Quercus suber]
MLLNDSDSDDDFEIISLLALEEERLEKERASTSRRGSVPGHSIGEDGEAPPEDEAVDERVTYKVPVSSKAIEEDRFYRSTTTIWESICSTSSQILGMSSPTPSASSPLAKGPSLV